MQAWRIQEAKARLLNLVKSAQLQPQASTVRSNSIAVVVSRETFDRLSQRNETLMDFMRRSPLFDADDVVLEHEPGLTREIAF